MYPDTDSPPQPVTRQRVEELAAALAEEPWVREERYSAAGVPRGVIHYLIRRGGARLVDLVAAECEADLRRACFFFGEKIKGVRREGLPVDEIPDEAWRDLFALCSVRPVLWEAWRDLVEWMAAHPGGDIFIEAALAGLGIEPKDWVESLQERVVAHRFDDREWRDEQRFRYLMGELMNEFRGRVPAARVADELRSRLEGSAVKETG